LTLRKFLAVIATLVAAGCATAPPPAPAPSAQEEHLIDPRTGWHGEKPDAIEHRFETAWRFFLAGDNATARQRLEDIRNRDAQYAPAALAEAAIDIREGHLDSARHAVDRIAEQYPNYAAAAVYEAEIDIAQNQIRSAYERYRTLIGRPDAPRAASARYAELQTRLFDQIYGAATSARPEDAIALLREALQINPAATAARVLLVRDLITLKRFDEAERELSPLTTSSVGEQPDVQEELAEIDVGRGQYEEAITRYERLARNDSA